MGIYPYYARRQNSEYLTQMSSRCYCVDERLESDKGDHNKVTDFHKPLSEVLNENLVAQDHLKQRSMGGHKSESHPTTDEEKKMEVDWAHPETVSYTHLDVYKRQPYTII